MPAPSIDLLPVPPLSNDSLAVFQSKRKPWIDNYEIFIDQLNALISWINSDYADSELQINILPGAPEYKESKTTFNPEWNAVAIALDTFIVQMNVLINAANSSALSLIDILPERPKLTDSKSTYNNRMFSWMLGVYTLPEQLNQFVEWVNEPPLPVIDTDVFAASYVNDENTFSHLVVDDGEIPFCTVRYNFNTATVDKIWQFPKIDYATSLSPNFLTMNGSYGVFLVTESSGDYKIVVLPGSETLLLRAAWEAATVDYATIAKITPLGSASTFIAAFNWVNISAGVFALTSGQPLVDDPDGTIDKIMSLQVVTFSDETDATADTTTFDIEAAYPSVLGGYGLGGASIAVNDVRTVLCATIQLLNPLDPEERASLVLEFDLTDNSLTDHYVREEISPFPYEDGANISPLIAISPITAGAYSNFNPRSGHLGVSTGNFLSAYDGFFTYSSRSLLDDGYDVLEVFAEKTAISIDVEATFVSTLTTKLVSLGFTVSDDNPWLGINMYLNESA